MSRARSEWRRRVVLAVLATAAVGAVTVAALGGAPPAKGEQAPDFALPTIAGPEVRLSAELAEGPVVLVVGRGWVGYQCPFCTRQFGDFLAHAREIEHAGARVLWVYPGPDAEIKQRAREAIGTTPIPDSFRFLLDPGNRFVSSWGLRWDAPNETAYPATFVIDRGGVVRLAEISRSHGDRVLAKDVVAALQALPR